MENTSKSKSSSCNVCDVYAVVDLNKKARTIILWEISIMNILMTL